MYGCFRWEKDGDGEEKGRSRKEERERGTGLRKEGSICISFINVLVPARRYWGDSGSGTGFGGFGEWHGGLKTRLVVGVKRSESQEMSKKIRYKSYEGFTRSM